jgi:hypothetical protein
LWNTVLLENLNVSFTLSHHFSLLADIRSILELFHIIGGRLRLQLFLKFCKISSFLSPRWVSRESSNLIVLCSDNEIT